MTSETNTIPAASLGKPYVAPRTPGKPHRVPTTSRFDAPDRRDAVSLGEQPPLFKAYSKPKSKLVAPGTSRFDAPAAAETPDQEREKIRVQVRKLLSATFFGPMMKQMRDSPFKSKLFDGGRGGDVFSSMLDQQLADRISQGAGDRLVESFVDRLAKLRSDQSLHRTQPTTRPESEIKPFSNVSTYVPITR